MFFDLWFVRCAWAWRCWCARATSSPSGVLPPLIMVVAFVVVAVDRPGAIASPQRRPGAGRGLRARAPQRGADLRLRPVPGDPPRRASAPPAERRSGHEPRRVAGARGAGPPGTPSDQSMTVVGSAGVSPASTTMSTSWSSSSLISQPIVRGSASPGRIRVLVSIGSPSASSSAWAKTWSGIRTPTVRFFGCSRRRGTSGVAGRMNVYGPGVAALIARNAALSTCTNWPSWEKSRHISVKWCRSSRSRIRRIRSRPVAVADPAAQGVARVGRVGDQCVVVAERVDDLVEQPRLRVVGVDVEEARHD